MKFENLSVEKIKLLNSEIVLSSSDLFGFSFKSGLDFAVDHILNNNNKSSFFSNLALLVRNIIQQHAFIDGNKRTGLSILEILLEDNSYKLNLNDKGKEKFVLDISKGIFKTIEDITCFIKSNVIII